MLKKQEEEDRKELEQLRKLEEDYQFEIEHLKKQIEQYMVFTEEMKDQLEFFRNMEVHSEQNINMSDARSKGQQDDNIEEKLEE